MRDWASELRAIADGRLMLNVRNGVTVSRSMLAMIADEIDALRAAPLTPAEVGGLVERLTMMAGIIEMGERIAWGSDTAIMREAAAALEAQAAELAAVHQRYVDANEARIDAEAQLAEARKALEWHPIETAPLNTIVDLWCTYADAPASWGNDRPAGQIVHNRHKSKEHGWFGNESNDGIPQANGPDLVPVAWRWPAPEIPLEMMERFVAARALEEQGGENGL